MENPIDTIKRQLAQLKELHESGVMSQVQYDEGKVTLERSVAGGSPCPSGRNNPGLWPRCRK
jgi:hypothetical protein